MNFRNAKLLRNTFSPIRNTVAEYSRKNNPNHEKYYKLVVKVDNNNSRAGHNALAPIPNWEILKPRGYRFFLPGNIGPALHDTRSNNHSLPPDFNLLETNFQCHAQECPILLRQDIMDHFPGIDFTFSELTIISLSQRRVTENDTEDVIKSFVLVAHNISQKLRQAGFWADFINPFSGLPGVSTYHHKDDLYETDPKFRSLGFQINNRKNCRIIEETKSKNFKGNLYTTAPAQTNVLRKLLLDS